MDNKKNSRGSSILPFYLLGFSLLIFSLACSLTGSTTTAATATAGEPVATVPLPENRPSAPTPVLAGPVEIGQPFLICDTAVTVLGWESYASKEKDFFQPTPGNRFIAVEVVLVNLGQQSMETIWFTFTLLDAYDEPIPEGLFPEMYVYSGSMQGGLAVGERTRGKIGYEVPEAEQEFSLQATCHNSDTFAKGEMTVKLGSRPRSVEAPGRFAGEIVQDPLALGKTARVNDIDITVKEVMPIPKKLVDPDDPRVPTPPDWMEYLIVELTLANRGIQEVELFVTSDMYAQDPEGVRYLTADSVAYVLEDPIRGFVTLKPGDEVSGQVAVQVPKGEGHLYFIFEYGFGQLGSRAYFLMR